jgi:hypothetical protein
LRLVSSSGENFVARHFGTSATKSANSRHRASFLGVASGRTTARPGDQHDAFNIAAWLPRADRDCSLAAFLKPDLSPPERTTPNIQPSACASVGKLVRDLMSFNVVRR